MSFLSSSCVTDHSIFGVVNLVEANGSGTTGKLHLVQSSSSSEVTIKGSIYNLQAGIHGFHVHSIGVTGNECADAGSHFNPTGVSAPKNNLQVISLDAS